MNKNNRLGRGGGLMERVVAVYCRDMKKMDESGLRRDLPWCGMQRLEGWL